MSGENIKIKKEKFSYSKLNTYDKTSGGCPWKYKLTYIDKHFVDSSTIANEFGTLIHYVEETIARDIMANDNEPIFMIDDNKYIDLFINADIHTEEETILGVKKLKEKYSEQFYEKDKSGMNYEEKANDYLNYGIFRLRDFLACHRNVHIIDAEKNFDLEYGDYIFHGFIDRVMQDVDTGELFIEDIKTWPNIDKHDLTTPLQFVFYSLAAQQIYGVSEDMISCFYDLPLAKSRYSAGTKGFIKRGCKKIDRLLNEIKEENFEPSPSALCRWCVFGKNYITGQPEEVKNLCPYYNRYINDGRKFNPTDVEFEWMGIENHEAVMEEFLKRNEKQKVKQLEKNMIELKSLDTTIFEANKDRIFLVRR